MLVFLLYKCCGNNSSFQQTEGLHLVDNPVLKSISFDSMNSVKKLGKWNQAAVDSTAMLVLPESKYFCVRPTTLQSTLFLRYLIVTGIFNALIMITDYITIETAVDKDES